MKRLSTIASAFVILLGLTMATSGVAAAAKKSGAATGHKSSAAAHKKSKHARQPVRVEFFGDSTAFTLAYSLYQKSLTSFYDYVINDQGSIGCGLVEGPAVDFMGKSDPPPPMCDGSTPAPGAPLSSQPVLVQWQADMAKFHPNVVVILAGRWEVADRVYDGSWTNILNPTFAAYVKQQLEMASNLITAAGANVVFMTSPCTNEAPQPDGQPWPESDPTRIALYNQMIREVAAQYPATDSVFDLNALVCPGGKFSPNYDGVDIRTSDGIHFTDQAGFTLGTKLMPPIVASGRAAIARAAESAKGRG